MTKIWLIAKDCLKTKMHIDEVGINVISVGDKGVLPIDTSIEQVAQYAKDNDYVIVTGDKNLEEQCTTMGVKFCSVMQDGSIRIRRTPVITYPGKCPNAHVCTPRNCHFYDKASGVCWKTTEVGVYFNER